MCSDFIKFHHKVDKWKSILSKNSYSRYLVDKCIKESLNKILAPKTTVSTVPTEDLVIALPYLSKLSLQIRKRINPIMKNNLPYNLWLVFQIECKTSNFFSFKDRIPSFFHCIVLIREIRVSENTFSGIFYAVLCSGVVYYFQCGGYDATYYGKSKDHFKDRICEHLVISALTGKRVKVMINLPLKNIFILQWLAW